MALQAQVQGKLAGKRDPMVEAEVLQWCSAVTGKKRKLITFSMIIKKDQINFILPLTGEPIPNGSYEDVLKDGVILCKFFSASDAIIDLIKFFYRCNNFFFKFKFR